MKKVKFLAMLLIATMSIAFTSCEKEEVQKLPAKYAIKFGSSTGYGTTLTIFECLPNGDKVYDRTLSVTQGVKYTFEAQEGVEKIKIYIKKINFIGIDTNSWVQRVFYLKEGETTNIIIDDNTVIGTNEP